MSKFSEFTKELNLLLAARACYQSYIDSNPSQEDQQKALREYESQYKGFVSKWGNLLYKIDRL